MFTAVLKGETRQKDLRQSACILPISVGQQYHEGDKFAATIELINVTFGECTIVIADTLGRHTALRESTEETNEEVQQKLRKKGDEWIERNNETLKKITIQLKIVRWDEYLQHSKYQTKKEQLDSLYRDDEPFKKAVEGSIEKFLRRYKQHQDATKHDTDKAFADSLEYVKEECAVLLLWPEIEKSDFLIYPNKLHEAMYNLRRRFIAPDNGDSTALQPLVVDFKKVKQSIELPQQQSTGRNGYSHVPQFLPNTPQIPNPAMFFQASQSAAGMEMSRQQLYDFIGQHFQSTLGVASSMPPKEGHEFLKISFAYINALIYPITVTDAPIDGIGDSNHSVKHKSSALSSAPRTTPSPELLA